jgi:hypothetical protein
MDEPFGDVGGSRPIGAVAQIRVEEQRRGRVRL